MAAGRGQRLGGVTPKALLSLGNQPLVVHATQALRAAGIESIVVAAPSDAVEQVRTTLAAAGLADVEVIPGGLERQQSVWLALQHLPGKARWVLVHDAARALAPPELATAVIDALAAGAPAVVPAVPVSDTIKQVSDGRVTATLDRSCLVAVQTPQGFQLDLLLDAHRRAAGFSGGSATDDAGLIEAAGVPVQVIPGSPYALKITRPLDLSLAELLLSAGESV